MTWEIIRSNWTVIWSLLTAAVIIVQLLLARTYARRDSLDRVTMRLDVLENTINHLPTREELHHLQLEISELRGEIREFTSVIKQAKHINDLLLENELKQKN
ncbi:TPA: DUF2730 family protein [Citrobacter amalonaticus]